jgi:hypothetical protein
VSIAMTTTMKIIAAGTNWNDLLHLIYVLILLLLLPLLHHNRNSGKDNHERSNDGDN